MIFIDPLSFVLFCDASKSDIYKNYEAGYFFTIKAPEQNYDFIPAKSVRLLYHDQFVVQCISTLGKFNEKYTSCNKHLSMLINYGCTCFDSYKTYVTLSKNQK